MPLRAWEFNSPLGHCRRGRCPTGFHTAGDPDRYRGLQHLTPVGQRSTEFHKLRPPGATPGPATYFCKRAEYANWKSGQVESLVILWVRLPPQSLRSRGPTARHQPDMLEAMVQLHPGSVSQESRDKSQEPEKDRNCELLVWLLSLDSCHSAFHRLLVQWHDIWLATRKSGFGSPAVH